MTAALLHQITQHRLGTARGAKSASSSVAAWVGDVERHDDPTLLLARRL